MTTPPSPHDRLLELLADREVGSLHEADRAELEGLLASSPEADDGLMEQAAVAAMLANLGEPEEMSDTLRRRTLHALATEERQSGRSVAAEPKPLTLEGSSQVIPSTHTPFLAWIGWVAAAACVLIAGFTIISRPAPTPTPTPPAPVQTLAESRRAFLESTPDLRTAQWGDWDNPELPGVTGTVEWSESAQKGYMTFEGLAVNVPTVEQYLLFERTGSCGEDGTVCGAPRPNGAIRPSTHRSQRRASRLRPFTHLEEVLRPLVYIPGADPTHHGRHAAPPLLDRHGDGRMQGVGHRSGAVRIHHQRFTQLGGCACEATQDERSRSFVRLTDAELLCDQVHPVPHGCDHCDIGGRVLRHELLAAPSPVLVVHRHPAPRREATVDLSHPALQLVA